MKLFCPILLLLFIQSASAQVQVTKLDKKTVPASVKYSGHIIDAVKYKDSGGEYLVITTETGETPTKNSEMEGRDAALYAYHYTIEGNGVYKSTWQTYDFIKDCPVDINASFIPGTFAVTDLDKNGKAEVWLMYKTVCHGDVSPSNMKIIMHEGDKKYAVRGTNKVKLSATETEGGKYTFDEVFKNGPEAFRQYAAKLWQKNIMETWK
ncbi:M949_RS01915 family surface polysaccharide biosynthesis protein [Mucilaginibacter gynuensis]|uniref:M949_RS01915 family surface polysaccharide biosynthesis protein n=1 Tax=Mucilaginibacter gynuensis TaxID=1302236 RepID=UPI003CD053DE